MVLSGSVVVRTNSLLLAAANPGLRQLLAQLPDSCSLEDCCLLLPDWDQVHHV
jgi:hypothetical protein